MCGLGHVHGEIGSSRRPSLPYVSVLQRYSTQTMKFRNFLVASRNCNVLFCMSTFWHFSDIYVVSTAHALPRCQFSAAQSRSTARTSTTNIIMQEQKNYLLYHNQAEWGCWQNKMCCIFFCPTLTTIDATWSVESGTFIANATLVLASVRGITHLSECCHRAFCICMDVICVCVYK